MVKFTKDGLIADNSLSLYYLRHEEAPAFNGPQIRVFFVENSDNLLRRTVELHIPLDRHASPDECILALTTLIDKIKQQCY